MHLEYYYDVDQKFQNLLCVCNIGNRFDYCVSFTFIVNKPLGLSLNLSYFFQSRSFVASLLFTYILLCISNYNTANWNCILDAEIDGDPTVHEIHDS